MPYKVAKKGKQWCVTNTETDKEMGCSDTKAKAYASVRARMANKPASEKADEESWQQKLDKVRTAFDAATVPETPEGQTYTPWSGLGIVDTFETYLLAKCYETSTYWKVLYSKSDEGEIEIQSQDDWQEMEITYVPVDGDDESESESESESEPEDEDETETKPEPVEEVAKDRSIKTAVRQVFKWLGETVGLPEPTPEAAPDALVGRLYTKEQEDGQKRWIAVSSTAFLDGHQEIVSKEGLDRGIARAQEKGAGDLVFWHNEEIPLGTCDYQLRSDACLIESGLWNDTPEAVAAQKSVEETPEAWGVSIKFWGLQSTSAVIKGITVPTVWTDMSFVERSILPADRAATKYSLIQTKTNVDGGKDMQTAHVDALTSLVGGTLATALVAQVDDVNAKAKEDQAIVKEAEAEDPFVGLQTLAQSLAATSPEVAKQIEDALAAIQTKTAAVVADTPEVEVKPGTVATPADLLVKATTPAVETPVVETPVVSNADIAQVLKGLGDSIVSLQKEVLAIKAGDAPRVASMTPGEPTAPSTLEKDDEPVTPPIVAAISQRLFPPLA